MKVVGLTGGIGSGKSTVAMLLAERGAFIVDADAIARDVVGPGRPAFVEIVEEFGPDVVADDGSIDRARLADLVFRDPAKRRRLEEITHPRVVAEMADKVSGAAHREVVVLDVPLLLESGSGARAMVEDVIVIAVPAEVAVERAEARGMDGDDARRRLEAQRPIEEKVAEADHVIWNTGTMAELRREVDLLWRKLTQ